MLNEQKRPTGEFLGGELQNKLNSVNDKMSAKSDG